MEGTNWVNFTPNSLRKEGATTAILRTNDFHHFLLGYS
jgi:hypothetical protein